MQATLEPIPEKSGFQTNTTMIWLIGAVIAIVLIIVLWPKIKNSMSGNKDGTTNNNNSDNNDNKNSSLFGSSKK